MSQEFDPYRTWLGIPAEEQPVNHYRLLGVPVFEESADVISNAADRQMTYIRGFQSGKNSALSQKVLNELSNARVTLLDPKKKEEYDKQLHAELASQQPSTTVPGVVASPIPVTPAGQPVPPASTPPAPPVGQNHSAPPMAPPARPNLGPNLGPILTPKPNGPTATRKNVKQQKDNTTVYAIVGGAVLMLLLLILVMFSGGSKDKQEVANGDSTYTPIAPVTPSNHTSDASNSSAHKTSSTPSNNTSDFPQPSTTHLDIPDSGFPDPTEGSDLIHTVADEEPSSTDNTLLEDLFKKTGIAKTFDNIQLPEYISSAFEYRSGNAVESMLLTPTTQQWYAVNSKGDIVHVNLNTGTLETIYENSARSFTCMGSSADGTILFVGYNPIQSEKDAYNKIIASPSFAQSDDEEDIRPYSEIVRIDLTSQTSRLLFKHKGYDVLSISPVLDANNNEFVAAAFSDGCVRIINTSGDSIISNAYLTFSAADEPVSRPGFPVAYAPGSNNSKKNFLKVVKPAAVPTCVQYHQNGHFVLCSNSIGQVYIFDLDDTTLTSDSLANITPKTLFRAKLSDSPILSAHFDSTYEKIFACTQDGVICEWNWLQDSDTPVQRLALGESIRYAALMGSRKYIAVQLADGTTEIRSWSQNGKLLATANEKTSLFVAEPIKNMFFAVKKGSTAAALQWYNVPEDIPAVVNDAGFKAAYSIPLFLPVPPEAQLAGSIEKTRNYINKELASAKNQTAKNKKIDGLLKKTAETKTMTPDMRYNMYLELLNQSVAPDNIPQSMLVINEILKYFDDDTSALRIRVFKQYLDSNPRGKTFQESLNGLISTADTSIQNGDLETAKDIGRYLGPKVIKQDELVRSMVQNLKQGKLSGGVFTDSSNGSTAISADAGTSAPDSPSSGEFPEELYSLKRLTCRDKARPLLQSAFGDSSQMETALLKAMSWLVDRQNPEGSWQFDYKVFGGRNKEVMNEGTAGRKNAATSLALLALLGAGEPAQKGEYKKAINLGLNYLAQEVRKNTILMEPQSKFNAHPMAAMAMIESQDEKYLQLVFRDGGLMDYIAWSVNNDGGWPSETKTQKDSSSPKSELSATYWNTFALSLAVQLFPEKVKDKYNAQITNAGAYFASALDNTNSDKPDSICIAGSGYLLAKGVLTSAQKNKITDAMTSTKIVSDEYITRYMRVSLMHQIGDHQAWRQFLNEDVRRILADLKKDEPEAGSWFTSEVQYDSQKHYEGGRLADTVMNIWILESSYRYPPVKPE